MTGIVVGARQQELRAGGTVGEKVLAILHDPAHRVVLVYGEVGVEAGVIARVPVEVVEAPPPVDRPVVVAVDVLRPVRVADCGRAVQRVVAVISPDVTGVHAGGEVPVIVVAVGQRPLGIVRDGVGHVGGDGAGGLLRVPGTD